ncbi:BQ2448_4172 [Microbotryum intermedium]|uniref:BQ2448_4172 protein n=1 Tax=Microbotryum intermedium TaxID=269621 RepID=A0A238FHH9_9BASI|nr:BQ2448_4172 [Microbotryum intermedium]
MLTLRRPSPRRPSFLSCRQLSDSGRMDQICLAETGLPEPETPPLPNPNVVDQVVDALKVKVCPTNSALISDLRALLANFLTSVIVASSPSSILQLSDASFVIEKLKQSHQLDLDRAKVEKELMQRQAEELANQLSQARAFSDAHDPTRRRRAPSLPNALDWSVDHDAFRCDDFVINSFRTRAEEAESRERELREDVKYLQRRLHVATAQLERYETELRRSRAAFLTTAPIIEQRTEIVLPSTGRLLTPPDESTRRHVAKLNRPATLGDAEAEHLLLAAKALRAGATIRRVQKVPLDKAIRRRAKQILQIPSEGLEEDGTAATRPRPSRPKRAHEDEQGGDEPGTSDRQAKRRRLSDTSAPDAEEEGPQDYGESELEATDIEDYEPLFPVAEPPKRVPSALDVLAEASSAASQSQDSSENLLPSQFSGVSSTAAAAPVEVLAAFAPPPPPGGYPGHRRFPSGAPLLEAPSPPAPPAVVLPKFEVGAQERPRQRQRSSTSATSQTNSAPPVPVLYPPPAPTSPRPIKAPAWVNGKPRKPRISISGAKKERAAYVKWNDHEDELLIRAVLKNGLRWENVAADVPQRSYHQVRQRFLRGLKSGWTLPPALEHYAQQVKKVVEENEKKKPRVKGGSRARSRSTRHHDDDDDEDEYSELSDSMSA